MPTQSYAAMAENESWWAYTERKAPVVHIPGIIVQEILRILRCVVYWENCLKVAFVSTIHDFLDSEEWQPAKPAKRAKPNTRIPASALWLQASSIWTSNESIQPEGFQNFWKFYENHQSCLANNPTGLLLSEHWCSSWDVCNWLQLCRTDWTESTLSFHQHASANSNGSKDLLSASRLKSTHFTDTSEHRNIKKQHKWIMKRWRSEAPLLDAFTVFNLQVYVTSGQKLECNISPEVQDQAKNGL